MEENNNLRGLGERSQEQGGKPDNHWLKLVNNDTATYVPQPDISSGPTNSSVPTPSPTFVERTNRATPRSTLGSGEANTLEALGPILFFAAVACCLYAKVCGRGGENTHAANQNSRQGVEMQGRDFDNGTAFDPDADGFPGGGR